MQYIARCVQDRDSHFGWADTEVCGMKLRRLVVLRQRVPAELQAHDEEPEGEREAHGADGDARGKAGADERAEDCRRR